MERRRSSSKKQRPSTLGPEDSIREESAASSEEEEFEQIGWFRTLRHADTSQLDPSSRKDNKNRATILSSTSSKRKSSKLSGYVPWRSSGSTWKSSSGSQVPLGERQYCEYHVSVPSKSKCFTLDHGGAPLLDLVHSFGYDSRRRGNLHVLAEKVLLIVSGAYLRVLDLQEGESRYLRATGHGSVSCAAVHPSRSFFASGESGSRPVINVFEYPSCRLYRVLYGGTARHYQCLGFNHPAGNLLASQGGEPDYQLTVWDWEGQGPLLRVKGLAHDVVGVSFSKYLDGHLVTYGHGHVRFWKIANTFTGLKLQGEAGKFGALGVTDVTGCEQLPDGQSLTGAEWGNLLLWDEAMVRAEVTCQDHVPCHSATINQVVLHEGELFTVGEDGKIIMWKYEDISTADPGHPGGQHVTRPIFTLEVGLHLKLLHMEKAAALSGDHESSREEDSSTWYVQDAGGNVWQVDLSFSLRAPLPKVVFKAHGGPVLGCAVSPLSHLLATGGADRTVRIYDCLRRKELASMTFHSLACVVQWLPLNVDPQGSSLVVGFGNGVVRKLVMRSSPDAKPGSPAVLEMRLSQAFKPHKDVVTSLAFSPDGKFLASVSSEATVFLFTISGSNLASLGWFTVKKSINHVTWTPEHFSYRGLLLACVDGVVHEVLLPDLASVSVTRRMELRALQHRSFLLASIKSELLRKEEKQAAIHEALENRRESRKKMLAYGLITEADFSEDEETIDEMERQEYEADGSEEDDNWEPYVPPTPSRIQHVMYDARVEGHIWLSTADYDAGYFYCCIMPEDWRDNDDEDGVVTASKPAKAVLVPGLEHETITAFSFWDRGLVLGLGLHNGVLCVIQLKEPYDLSDLKAFWRLCLHDIKNGNLTGVKIAFDKSFMVTTGSDGNIFLFSYAQKLQTLDQHQASLPTGWDHHKISVVDIPPNALCLREELDKQLMDERHENAEASKKERRAILQKLRKQVAALIQRNQSLPPDIRLPREEMCVSLDMKEERAAYHADMINQIRKTYQWMSEKNSIGVNKLLNAYKPSEENDIIVLKAIRSEAHVQSYRIPPPFPTANSGLEGLPNWDTHFDSQQIRRQTEREFPPPKPSRSDELFEQMYESFQSGALTGQMARRLRYGLEFVRRARDKRAARRKEWDALYREKPEEDAEDPKDVEAIEEAKRTIGMQLLRDDPSRAKTIRVQHAAREGMGNLVAIEQMMRDKIVDFNSKLRRLRDDKCAVVEIIAFLRNKLLEEEVYTGNYLYVTDVKDLEESVGFPDVPTLCEKEVPELRYVYDEIDLVKFRREMDNRQAAFAAPSTVSIGAPPSAREKRGSIWKLGDDHLSLLPKKVSSVKIKKSEERISVTQQRRLSVKQKDSQEGIVPKTHHLYYRGEARSPPATIATYRRYVGTISRGRQPYGVGHIIEEPGQLSPLQQEYLTVQLLTQQHQKTALRNLVASMEAAFDSVLRSLQKEKAELDMFLVRAELRYITQMEEFIIHRRTVTEEAHLDVAVMKAEKEVVKLKATKEKLTAEIADVNAELVMCNEQLTELWYHLQDAMVDLAPKRQQFLTRIFRKRVREKRMKVDPDDSSESSSDDSDSSNSESNEDSEAPKDLELLDECPPDLDHQLFEYAWQLQKKRQALDDVINSHKLDLERWRKDLEKLAPMMEPLQKAAAAAHLGLLQCRMKVQQECNDLDVIVPLSLTQLTKDLQLMSDISSTVVLQAKDLQALKERGPALKKEVQHVKKQFQHHLQELTDLRRKNAALQSSITLLEKRCNVEMQKKFGRIIPLAKLEMAMVNPKLEVVRARLLRHKNRQLSELQTSEAKITRLRDKLADLTKHNTELIRLKTEMCAEFHTLTASLDKMRKRVNKVELGLQVDEERKALDFRDLVVLVGQQAEEITWCRREIDSLTERRGLAGLAPVRLVQRRCPGVPKPVVDMDALRRDCAQML